MNHYYNHFTTVLSILNHYLTRNIAQVYSGLASGLSSLRRRLGKEVRRLGYGSDGARLKMCNIMGI